MKHNVLHQLAIGLTLFVLSGFVCPTVTFSQIAGIDYIQKALEADERGDLSLATSYYHIAAEAGNVESQYMLGCRYLLGKGVAVDYAEGAKWIRKAAEQGYGSAQSSMGVCYESGMGVPQDNNEAIKWYRKAAAQGDASAIKALQKLADSDDMVRKGVDAYKAKNYAEAVKWLRPAAEQGNDAAQDALGMCYEFGNGVAKDHAEALKWYRKAAAKGNVSAQESVKKLTGQAKSAGNSSKASASTQSKTNNSKENSKPTKGTVSRTFIGCKLRVSTISDVKAQLALRSFTPTVNDDGSLFCSFLNEEHKLIDDNTPKFCGEWWQTAVFSFINDGKLDQIFLMNEYRNIKYAEIYYDKLKNYILEHYHFGFKSSIVLKKRNNYEELGHFWFGGGVTTYVLIYGYSSGTPFVALRIEHHDLNIKW